MKIADPTSGGQIPWTEDATSNGRSFALSWNSRECDNVIIELQWTDDRLYLIISDNGHGMRGGQAGVPVREGVGIYGIRARARQLGAISQSEAGRAARLSTCLSG